MGSLGGEVRFEKEKVSNVREAGRKMQHHEHRSSFDSIEIFGPAILGER